MTSFFSLSFSPLLLSLFPPLVTRFPNADFHFLSSYSLICVFTLTPSLSFSFLSCFPSSQFLSLKPSFSLSLLLTFLLSPTQTGRKFEMEKSTGSTMESIGAKEKMDPLDRCSSMICGRQTRDADLLEWNLTFPAFLMLSSSSAFFFFCCLLLLLSFSSFCSILVSSPETSFSWNRMPLQSMLSPHCP